MTSQNSMNCSEAPSREETENLIREIYSNMKLFGDMLHETRQRIKSNAK